MAIESESLPPELTVLNSLIDPSYDFHTSEGIARDTGIQIDTVEKILQRYSLFLRSPLIYDSYGRKLYVPAGKPVGWRECLVTIRAVITKNPRFG